MKILGKILFGALTRAFTKKNGSLVATTTPEGQWDLEATLAWFIRCLLAIFLIWLAGQAGVEFDPNTIPF
jgi:hypothetical protein